MNITSKYQNLVYFFTQSTPLDRLRYYVPFLKWLFLAFIIYFDYIFFKSFVKNTFNVENSFLVSFFAILICGVVSVVLNEKLASFFQLIILAAKDTNKTQYLLKLVMVFIMTAPFLTIALYASYNGVQENSKNNVALEILPTEDKIIAAKDSLAASQAYYNAMLLAEDKKLSDAINAEYSWKSHGNNQVAVQSAARQKEILIQAKVEQAKFWQSQIAAEQTKYEKDLLAATSTNKELLLTAENKTNNISAFIHLLALLYALTSLVLYSNVESKYLHTAQRTNLSPTQAGVENSVRNGQTDNGQADKGQKNGQTDFETDFADFVQKSENQALEKFVTEHEKQYKGITNMVEKFLYPLTETDKKITQQEIADTFGIDKRRMTEKMQKYRQYFSLTKPIDFDKEKSVWDLVKNTFRTEPINGSKVIT